MLDLQLVSKPSPEIDIHETDEFLALKFPGKTTFSAPDSMLQNECAPFDINWLIAWSIAYVLTEGYRNSVALVNPFLLKTKDGETERLENFKNWRTGLRAGLQSLAIHMQHEKAFLLTEAELKWQGALALRREVKARAPIVTIKDLDKVYGEGFAVKVAEVFKEIEAYGKGNKVEPVITPPDVPSEPVKPLPKPPKEEPKPIEPEKPEGKSHWKGYLATAASILGVLVFFAQALLPGWATQLVKLLIALFENLSK